MYTKEPVTIPNSSPRSSDCKEELRDRFAIAYLQGKMANGATSSPIFSHIAADAYKMADEMLKARKQK